METDTKNKPFQPKPMIDLLPELDGILSKESIRTLTAVKRPRNTMVTSTAVKSLKPLTIAEMRAEILAMRKPLPSRCAESATSSKKKVWNSSVKVDKKTKAHTADGQSKHNTVRKVLNFQPKPVAISNSRLTVNSATPKFRIPELRAKKSAHIQSKATVRISGICNIPETPIYSNKIVQNRMTLANKDNFSATTKVNPKPLVTCLGSKEFVSPQISHTSVINSKIVQNRMTLANKENFVATANTKPKPSVTPLECKEFKAPSAPCSSVVNNKTVQNAMTLTKKVDFITTSSTTTQLQFTPVMASKNFIAHPVTDTPLSNMSWMSDNDKSFLEKEKEIQDIQEKEIKQHKLVKTEEQTLENIAEESPPASTPFKEYRSVQEFFDHSNDTDTSALYNDNTIMSFEKISENKKNNSREESVIVSLCDLLNKATVTNPDQMKTELCDLLEIEKQLEANIKMVDNGIKTLSNIKESELKTLKYVKKLKNEKLSENNIKNEHNNVLMKAKSMPKLMENTSSNGLSPVSSRSCSTITIKSPSYKIPKKNCLRKKILYKSMPNVSEGMCRTPNKDMDKRAFNMYMGMKKMEQMSFLNTPGTKRPQRVEVPDTPTLTSHNLQMQLDKIFKDNT